MNKTLYKNWLEKHFIPFYKRLNNPDDMFLCEAIRLYCAKRKIILQDNVYLKFMKSCILQDLAGTATLYDYLYKRYREIHYSEGAVFWRRPARICYLRELADRITPHAVVRKSEPKENLNESI